VHQLYFSEQCILTEGAWLLGGASAIWLWYGMVESRWIVSLFVVFRPNRPENDPRYSPMHFSGSYHGIAVIAKLKSPVWGS